MFDAEMRFEDKVRDDVEKKMLAARNAVVTIIDVTAPGLRANQVRSSSHNGK